MYDDLNLTAQQRLAIDSVSDAALKETHALLAPVEPQIDSVRNQARKSIENLMTPAQRQKFDEKRKEFQDRQAKVQAHQRFRRQGARRATWSARPASSLALGRSLKRTIARSAASSIELRGAFLSN